MNENEFNGIVIFVAFLLVFLYILILKLNINGEIKLLLNRIKDLEKQVYELQNKR